MQLRCQKEWIPALVRRLILAWLTAALTEYLLLPAPLRDLAGLDGLKQMSLLRLAAVTGLVFAGLWVLSRRFDTEKWERWGIVAVFALLSAAALTASWSSAFFLACLLILGVLIVYAVFGWQRQEETPEIQKAWWGWLWLTGLLAAAFFLFVSVWTVCRVFTMSTPSYDFGIFSQMFYNMKESLLPMTTLERDGLLSHFQVHVSPIYYLMLPFYCLWPQPETLQILQAAVLASSVIPLWLIGKQHGLSGPQRMLLCLLLLVYPAFSGGTGYDLHENCFLTPLILWLLYGIDRKNIPITAVAALLTLMVKEDAAVYVAVAALWLIVKSFLRTGGENRWGLIAGVLLLAAALGWFWCVTGYLSSSGDGVMTYRYDNFIFDGSGSLLTVIKAVFLSPMKALFECVDVEKLKFIGQTFLVLLGLPLLTRKFERYLLLIPYVLVNLMSDYQYQHDIFFQYTFGSTAFLLYLTAVNLGDLKGKWQRFLPLTAAVAISISVFCGTCLPKGQYYAKMAAQYQDYYQNVRQTLSVIPEGASVSATTFYTTFLSDREVLYDVRYAKTEHVLSTEYVALHATSAGEYRRYGSYENLARIMENNGYEVFHRYGNIVVIYRKAQS